MQQCHSELEPANVNEEEMWSETSLSECLDGFLLLADASGMILYVSESVYVFLGLTQVIIKFVFSWKFHVRRNHSNDIT